MNSYHCTGRLVADPTLHDLPSGDTVCSMRLAVDGMGQGGRDQVGYLDVVQFGAGGKAAAKHLSRGWLVAFAGRLEWRTWDDNGATRHAYRGVGAIEFLSAPRDKTNGPATRDETWKDAIPEPIDETAAAMAAADPF